MPLFGNNFSPKKGPARKFPSMSNLNLDASTKQTEFGIEMTSPLRLKLGENEIVFDEGHWISGLSTDTSNPRELMQMKKNNMKMVEENNFLKIKIELLLDLLSEKTAEVNLQDNEIEQLKRLVKKR